MLVAARVTIRKGLTTTGAQIPRLIGVASYAVTSKDFRAMVATVEVGFIPGNHLLLDVTNTTEGRDDSVAAFFCVPQTV